MTASQRAEIHLQRALSKSLIPGAQYVVLNRHGTRFEYAGGWADLQHQKPMTLATALMAYSMSKTITAAATLQLVEQGRLDLDESIDTYVDDSPYGAAVRVRHLLCHTSGIPNPIPLRWVHLAEKHSTFDEIAALKEVLHDHAALRFRPGEKFLYSNIGYWLLGRIIANVTGQPFEVFVRAHLLAVLGIPASELSYVIPESDRMANGYLEKYSFVNLCKGFLTDRELWGDYEGRWLHLRAHYVNAPAFGGLVGTARGFAQFLEDQLQEKSALFSPSTRDHFFKQQTIASGRSIPMTLGWHLGQINRVRYFYKEGGGGGFRSEMRVYPETGMASVLMVNATSFNVRRALGVLDKGFLEMPAD
jgi:D-alanyl-D-alanine carboxypeptidase